MYYLKCNNNSNSVITIVTIVIMSISVVKDNYYLSPFGRGQHQLKTIKIANENNDDNEIVIGRNPVSVYISGQENINVVSRKHMAVRMNGNQVQIR